MPNIHQWHQNYWNRMTSSMEIAKHHHYIISRALEIDPEPNSPHKLYFRTDNTACRSLTFYFDTTIHHSILHLGNKIYPFHASCSIISALRIYCPLWIIRQHTEFVLSLFPIKWEDYDILLSNVWGDWNLYLQLKIHDEK